MLTVDTQGAVLCYLWTPLALQTAVRVADPGHNVKVYRIINRFVSAWTHLRINAVRSGPALSAL